MFGNEFSRLFTLSPDLKFSINRAPAISPLSSAGDPVLQRSQFFVSGGSLEETHCQIDVCTAIPGRRSFHLPESGRDTIHTTQGRRSSVERSQEWVRQQTGLRSTFPLYRVQGTVTCAASLLQDVLSWGFHPS